MDNYQKTVGPIPNAKTAGAKAEEVWLELYGDEVKDEKPYIVSYDARNLIWMVEGYMPSLPIRYAGGTA